MNVFEKRITENPNADQFELLEYKEDGTINPDRFREMIEFSKKHGRYHNEWDHLHWQKRPFCDFTFMISTIYQRLDAEEWKKHFRGLIKMCRPVEEDLKESYNKSVSYLITLAVNHNTDMEERHVVRIMTACMLQGFGVPKPVIDKLFER